MYIHTVESEGNKTKRGRRRAVIVGGNESCLRFVSRTGVTKSLDIVFPWVVFLGQQFGYLILREEFGCQEAMLMSSRAVFGGDSFR